MRLRLLPLCVAAILTGCTASGRAADGVADESAGLRLVAVSDLPAVVRRGEEVTVALSLRNDGLVPVAIEFGADVVSLRATIREPLPSGPDIRSGVFWVPVQTTAQDEVIAIGYGSVLAPGASADLPPLRVPMTLARGTYTVRACARLYTAPTASVSEWCAPGVPLKVE